MEWGLTLLAVPNTLDMTTFILKNGIQLENAEDLPGITQ